jgi:uncharacterized protein (DUF2237 family)
VCALRWREAYEAGCAPPVVLEARTPGRLDFVLIEWLRKKRLGARRLESRLAQRKGG